MLLNFTELTQKIEGVKVNKVRGDDGRCLGRQMDDCKGCLVQSIRNALDAELELLYTLHEQGILSDEEHKVEGRRIISCSCWLCIKFGCTVSYCKHGACCPLNELDVGV